MTVAPRPPTGAADPDPALRLLALPRYDALGASSRVRLLQFLPALGAAGIAVDVRPLLSDEYLRHKYAGRGVRREIVTAYARRTADLLAPGRDVDIVWIEKELWPWMPAAVERRMWRRAPVVLDYDDAIFHTYDQHPNAIVRRAFGRKIDRLMAAAALVIAGNAYLAERARAAGARQVEILPTVVDTGRYLPRDTVADEAVDADTARPVIIGWIGTPATVGYLRLIAGPLAAIAKRRRVVLRTIGARIELPGVACEHVPWSAEGEARALAAVDVGVMPLPDSPWERGKCGYKLIQCLACGVPVVASPVGANREIVAAGGNGLLASSDAEWVAALETLATDAVLRQRLGAQGRRDVEARYSLATVAPKLVTRLLEVGASARSRGH